MESSWEVLHFACILSSLSTSSGVSSSHSLDICPNSNTLPDMFHCEKEKISFQQSCKNLFCIRIQAQLFLLHRNIFKRVQQSLLHEPETELTKCQRALVIPPVDTRSNTAKWCRRYIHLRFFRKSPNLWECSSSFQNKKDKLVLSLQVKTRSLVLTSTKITPPNNLRVQRFHIPKQYEFWSPRFVGHWS